MLNDLKRSQRPPSSTDPSPAHDLVGLLLECHERIRRFLDIAVRLALRPPIPWPEGEIRETALALHRYFSQALPLHVRDEEETLQPRLAGRDPEVDDALAEMRKEHAAHEAVLRCLLVTVLAIAEEPARHETLAEELRPIAEELRTQLLGHLLAEEQTLFPAVTRLCDADTQAAMVEELRQRRSS